MRKFQCLFFALKRSYILLYNLLDCTFNTKVTTINCLKVIHHGKNLLWAI